MTDNVLRTTGYKYLAEKLGRVNAERFISLMIAEPFDYTKWRGNLYEGMSVRELSNAAQKAFVE